MCCIAVTEDGLGCYGLQPFGPGSGYELVLPGTFAGLDILCPDTEYPVLITTTKTDQCCFLEMRGIIIFNIDMSLNLDINLPDLTSSWKLIRRIPLSCICSMNLGMSCITHIKVDQDEQVTRSSMKHFKHSNALTSVRLFM